MTESCFNISAIEKNLVAERVLRKVFANSLPSRAKKLFRIRTHRFATVTAETRRVILRKNRWYREKFALLFIGLFYYNREKRFNFVP